MLPLFLFAVCDYLSLYHQARAHQDLPEDKRHIGLLSDLGWMGP